MLPGIDASNNGQSVQCSGVGNCQNDKSAGNTSKSHGGIGQGGRKGKIGPGIRSLTTQLCKSCVRESFRLHPIAPFNVPHVSTVDAIVAGYFIPKGVNLGCTMTAMLMARLLQAFSWELPSTVAKIELKESAGDLFLAEPLHVKAQPRLAEALYHQL
ncbi:hypothetical protein Vadar_015177 [Vaccinium darrowii]|uniref:Uncharacterized protein n=1 Tax=Vaccinium darrowii TaxID=229202 RepID=A0ACB7X9Y0_9ERIC|nr:hypothetical protein Vadar_015177 [Vaccinium darrowii]